MSARATADFTIEAQGPFSWAAATDFMAGFPPTEHHWRGTSDVVRMSFPLDREFTPVAVALRADGQSLRGEVAGGHLVDAVRRQVARIFSLDVDAGAYPAVAAREPAVGRLMEALPGLRPVLFTSPYECAAWAVISQRITQRQAARIKEWLIGELGEPIEVAGETIRCFPPPERLLHLEVVPGLSGEKVARLRGVAAAALEGRLDADRLRELGDQAAPAALRELPGIGDFWSQGIYVRACGVHDVFPQEPISLRALAAVRGLSEVPRGPALEEVTAPYRPFRMWVCVLLRVAAGRGLIPGVDGRRRPGDFSPRRGRR